MCKAQDPLITAALQVFSRYGVKKTTMGDIANAAGVSRQTLYNRFNNKDDVFRSTVAHLSQSQLSKMKSDWAGAATLADKIDVFYSGGPIFWYDMIAQTPDAADLLEGLHTLAGHEVEQGDIQWRAAVAEMLEPYNTGAMPNGTTTDDLGDFLYASAHSAKADATDRDHMLRRLSVIKSACLALLGSNTAS